jgi:hypothetical protein
MYIFNFFWNTGLRCSFPLIKLSWHHIEPDWCPYNSKYWDYSVVRCYGLRLARMPPRFQSSGPADTTVRGAPWVAVGRVGRFGEGKVQNTRFFFCNSAERKFVCGLSEWISLFWQKAVFWEIGSKFGNNCEGEGNWARLSLSQGARSFIYATAFEEPHSF